MRYLFISLLSLSIAVGQTPTSTASISGMVLDAATQKPIPVAIIMAIQTGLSPISRNTRSGADGGFRIDGLPAGNYSLCAQVPGDRYLDPCQWNASPVAVSLVSGQVAAGASLRLTASSIVTIQVQDGQKSLSQNTKDGRRPDLTLGVWGPNGLYYPAHVVRGGGTGPQSLVNSYNYQIAVPRDTALKIYIASKDVKLGDASGTSLAGNASQQSFLHATGDANPKSFVFTVLGLAP
jgi:hypothetical protein